MNSVGTQVRPQLLVNDHTLLTHAYVYVWLFVLQDGAVLEYERRMSALRSSARMQATLMRKEQVLEERRQAVLAAEAAAEFRMQQKEEVRSSWRLHNKF